jgi:hypothetical protein
MQKLLERKSNAQKLFFKRGKIQKKPLQGFLSNKNQSQNKDSILLVQICAEKDERMT